MPNIVVSAQSLRKGLPSLSTIAGIISVLLLGGCAPPPPATAPLSAAECYMSGIKYKKRGRIELSREQLQKAIQLDGNGEIAVQARLFMNTQLPRYKTSQEIEQRNAIGFNQLAHKDVAAARKTFEDLIKDFPNFEWSYLNLAIIELQEDKLDEAGSLLTKAVALNPNYLKAWATLAELKQRQQDIEGAAQCLKRCEQLEHGQTEALSAEQPKIN